MDQSDQRQSDSDSDRMWKSGGCLLAILLICLPSLLSSQEQEQEQEEEEEECEGGLDCASQLLPGQYLCINR